MYRLAILAVALLMIECISSQAWALVGSTGPGGSNAKAVHAHGHTGTGVKIALLTTGNIYANHAAFRDAEGLAHAFAYDYTGSGISANNHETFMAGIMISRGDPNHLLYLGVAPDADLYNGRVVDGDSAIYTSYLTNALNDLVVTHGCRVVLSGFQLAGSPLTLDGQSIFSLMYDYYAYNYDVVFANAAGNDYSQITIFGDAYNGITTGGLLETDSGTSTYGQVGTASNSGPTADGRHKPDVAAPSQNQLAPFASEYGWGTGIPSTGVTSYSVPHTAGVAALLLGFANTSVDLEDAHNEVIRAVIVNSTFPNIKNKSGLPTYPAMPGNTWNTDRGYGRIDALRAFQTISADQITRSQIVAADKGWAYDIMGSNAEHLYNITVIKNHRLILTVTWNRKVNKIGGNYSAESPVYNLDLTVASPGGSTVYAETNALDNLEKIDILLPEDGVYQVSLRNTTSTNNRDYALAFELLPPLPGDVNLDYIVDDSDWTLLAGQWLSSGAVPSADMNRDGVVNLSDFAGMVTHWLQIDSRYYADH